MAAMGDCWIVCCKSIGAIAGGHALLCPPYEDVDVSTITHFLVRS
jgi:hypothetical protein